jgi:hypothetical protein
VPIFCCLLLTVKRRFAVGGKMKTHDITVTIMQAIVLLMFNNSALDQPLGYLEIKQKIGTLLFDNDPTLLNTLAAISFDSR